MVEALLVDPASDNPAMDPVSDVLLADDAFEGGSESRGEGDLALWEADGAVEACC